MFSVPTLRDDEFLRFRTLVVAEAGIHLSENKRSLLTGRLMRRLRQLRCATFGAYYDIVTASDEEKRTFVDLVLTNETHFFREPQQFSFLENVVCARWNAERRQQPIRVWSAGCSTGEEPFSIGMTLLHHVRECPIEIVATDLSVHALDTAAAATWPISRASRIPPHFLTKYMLRGVGHNDGVIRATKELRNIIRFARLNLHRDAFAELGKFDVIFCRNVLIYFDRDGRAAIVDRLLDQLIDGGLFLVGHAETLSALTTRVRNIGPSIHELRH